MIDQTNALDQAYLDKNWDPLAAIGWEQFRTHGRGALLVQNTGEPNEKTIFLPLTMLTANPLGQHYVALVREYDPRREVVIIFMRPPHSVTVYQGALPGREAPPEAYRRFSAMLFSR